MATVEVRDLSKRFGKVEAVKNLSFDVQAGRVTGFLGPNGAGKSTTLRALLGLIHPTGLDVEAEVLDGLYPAEALGEVADLDGCHRRA